MYIKHMYKTRIIVNADDCGYSETVSSHISAAIEKHRVTSTTIMANKDDFEGAIRMYNEYHDSVSFGFHLNLTEGHPLTSSQQLLDIGFFKEENGTTVFNAQPFRRKLLSKSVREAIYNEALAQATSIMDSGVNLSHIDGHHFIHQAVFMLPLLPRLCKEIGVHKVRNYRNYMPKSINKWARGQWVQLIKFSYTNIRTTDWFTGFEDFYKLEASAQRYYQDGETIELMCHPGGKYFEEEDLLMNTDVEMLFQCELINYYQI